MLWARTVLGEQARPVLPIGGDIRTTDALHEPYLHSGMHGSHSCGALMDDVWISNVEADA